jgi:hypothetical protein
VSDFDVSVGLVGLSIEPGFLISLLVGGSLSRLFPQFVLLVYVEVFNVV